MELQEASHLELRKDFGLSLEMNQGNKTKQKIKNKGNSSYRVKEKGIFTILTKIPFSTVDLLDQLRCKDDFAHFQISSL